MARVSVPEPAPGWFQLRDISTLNADHQDDYDDLRAKIFARLRKEAAAAAPPPENPAKQVIGGADDAGFTVTRKDLFPVQALVIGWVLEDNSYGITLPWTAEERRKLKLPAWNTLRAALEPYYTALNGEAPKETTEDSTTSGSTSTGDAPAPPPESPPEQ